MDTTETPKPTNFIIDAVAEDLKTGRFNYVRTRLPPEPNGYLHIGHVKAFLIDYNTAKAFGGELVLRFDDTNPAKEETEFVEAIEEDARWLGIQWVKVTFASDYFDRLYEWAIRLVKKGLAYVDDQTPEEMSASRGTLPRGTKWSQTESALKPGIESPYRNRSVEENLDLLERMKNGEFPEGSRVLRAKIDMAHPNIVMRDPVMYRIMHATHHRTGDKWCIYPMYDWSHGQNDSMEGITHSLCSKEYIIHRPLYEWFLEQLGEFKTRQIEFSRLNLTYAMMSKRKLRKLVENGVVSGWDDPRLTTLRGLRRRGVTPEAIQNFIASVGETNNDSWVDMALLEAFIRDDLNKRSPRRMAILHPLKLVIDNYPGWPVGRDERDQQPRRRNRRDAQSAVLESALHRTGRFSRDSAAQVFPAVSRQRDPPALCLPGQMHRRHPRPANRGGDRGALHLRPGHARRRCPGWAQGQIHHPLGLGAARHQGRSAPLRAVVHRREPG